MFAGPAGEGVSFVRCPLPTGSSEEPMAAAWTSSTACVEASIIDALQGPSATARRLRLDPAARLDPVPDLVCVIRAAIPPPPAVFDASMSMVREARTALALPMGVRSLSLSLRRRITYRKCRRESMKLEEVLR